MTSSPPAPPVRPRVLSLPPAVSSVGREAIELAAHAGLVLDPWEAFVLDNALRKRADGKWAAFEVGLMVSRQNGKGAILEARELAGLFLLGERLIIHSAHQFDTSQEAFLRLKALIQETPDLNRRVKRYAHSHGEEGIELKNGQRIRFRTRTKGGGRGFTGDTLMLDEAMILPQSFHGALLPTLSARSVAGNPQVWYTGSAVDQLVHEHGVVLSRIRNRGLAGGDPSLAYFEYSADRPTPDDVEDLADRELWAEANPGLGIRISAEHIGHELRSMGAREFAVERLGVGDWPDPDGTSTIIDLELWATLATEEKERPREPLCFAFDVTPDRSRGAIAVAGRRADELYQIEVVEAGRGTGWIVPRLAELCGKHKYVDIPCDASGPAASLLPELGALKLRVQPVTAGEHGKACGFFYDSVEQSKLRHVPNERLLSALRGAAQRSLGDAWAWHRKSSAVDISPLVACTLALWGSSSTPVKSIPRAVGFS